jgi:hypothetical protein
MFLEMFIKSSIILSQVGTVGTNILQNLEGKRRVLVVHPPFSKASQLVYDLQYLGII